MKKKMARWVKLLICCLMVLILSSCWSARELNTIAIVMGIGMDKSKEINKVDMTVQVVDPSRIKTSTKESYSKQGGNTAFVNLRNDGTTISQALKGINRKLNRELFFSDNQVLIIGKSLAEEGIGNKLDFFLRNRETRLLVWLLVSKDNAGEVLDISPKLESITGSNIAKQIEIERQYSQIPAVNLKDFSTKLMSNTTSPVAPMIEILKEKNDTTVFIKETAVFKKDKMIGKLDNKETKGLLWVINEIKSGNIEVTVPGSNDKVSLEITRSKSKIVPSIKDNKVNIKLEIKEEGDLSDQLSDENLAKPKAFEELEKAKAIVIKDEVMTAVKKAKELNADIFGFGDVVHQHYPKEWKEMQYDWENVFPTIEVEVKVEAKLRRTGRITKSIITKEE